ncbi:MAG: hypothetical protein FWC99_02380 [Coriobacteriia bacterium]|nr:hypothetical protein [Coriobacteriia bacterium]
MNTTELRNEYLKIIENLPELDQIGRESAAHYMCYSEAIYKDEVADFLYVPKLYTARERTHFQQIATTTLGILEKIVKAYLDDPEYRTHFDFPKELEDLILLDPGYSSAIPLIRIDIFYDEDSGDFKFCEFNTDGSSAMNEDREATNALALTPSFEAFSAKLAHEGFTLEGFELFDSWVDTFLDIYADSAQNAKNNINNRQGAQGVRPTRLLPAKPNVVISDFMDISTPVEIERFAKHFEARGLQVEVCDIRDLRFEADSKSEPLLRTPSGMRVDALYRRAVTGDIMKHYEQVTDFLDAYRAGAFTLIGSFRTQLPHTKLSFEVLHLPQTLDLLTKEEVTFVQAHVPYTVRLSAELPVLDEIVQNKDVWIIKPLDSYGSKGVWAGRELSKDAWEDLIRSSVVNQDHIAQKYIEQYSAPNLESGFFLPAMKKPTLKDGLPAVRKYRDLTGLFVYGGQFKGLLARAGLQDRICAAAEGKCLGTYKVLD